ncbi:MAG: UvrD-helicase domain-containing protein [Eubacteriales bacterium]|nr:UvrD-helicase domain-containing protein [Eubacteriales bacterium]
MDFLDSRIDELLGDGQVPNERREFTEGLNDEQRAAVLHRDGPLLVLAGAGSGKTRVITHRIARLIEHDGVSAGSILALTFTNKAASEMKQRIEALLQRSVQRLWIGTFHSIMLRILRRFAARIEFQDNFSIVDEQDKLRIFKQVAADLHIAEDNLDLKWCINRISMLKSHAVYPEDLSSRSQQDPKRLLLAQIYEAYQLDLRQRNAMDFDDLLLLTCRLLEENPDVLRLYQEHFKYILVDEYQDTNPVQCRLLQLFAGTRANICVVGDDDQSIYGFRGADASNIGRFRDDFPGAIVIKLEQNYRSTKMILDAANSVISNNKTREGKRLWTDSNQGEKIRHISCEDHIQEGRFILKEMERLMATGSYVYRDFAVLYRQNALMRHLELIFTDAKIPFHIHKGMSFYSRAEIRDALAYLSLIVNPNNSEAFDRIYNTPRRGIGTETKRLIDEMAERHRVSPLAICFQAAKIPELSRKAKSLSDFATMILSMHKLLLSGNYELADFVSKILDDTGLEQMYLDQMERSGDQSQLNRIENLRELISAIIEFSDSSDDFDVFEFDEEEWLAAGLEIDEHLAETFKEQKRLQMDMSEAEPQPTASAEKPEPTTSVDRAEMTEAERAALGEVDIKILANFLDHIALSFAVNERGADEDAVQLMTVHSAKGLEFRVVFVIGMEEEIFPSGRSSVDQKSLEEERRLAYVAFTRARELLYLSSCNQRLLYGKTQIYLPSRFVGEIPQHCIDAQQIGLSRMGLRRQSLKSSTYGTQTASSSRSGTSTWASNPRRQAMSFDGFSGVQAEKKRAELNKIKRKRSQIDLSSLAIGMTVKHRRYGLGKVLSMEPIAGDMILEISFSAGIKRLMFSSAGLEIPQ